jgi:hypothetical protein
MIHNQNLKVVAHTSGPAVVGSTATVSLVVDRIGYDQASMLVMKSAAAAATSFATVLKVEESDVAGSGYSDVPAFVKDASGGFTMDAVSTTAASAVKMDVDCKARKRYLRVTMSPDVSATVSIVALLSRGEEFPYDATTVNVNKWVTG